MELYRVADIFFFSFHTLLIFFNTFGWVAKRTRLYNLITLLLTAFSWFILGIWYGWGYCFCTDWHWTIRHKLGYIDTTNSYVGLLLNKVTGIDVPDTVVDSITGIVFTLSLIMSLYFNIKDHRKKKKMMR